MNRLESKKLKRENRKKRVRKHISGTASRPRLTLYKSNKNIFVQAIDDIKGCTICTVSTYGKDSKLEKTVESGGKIGEAIGAELKKKKIKSIVFDRNGYRYHGIVKAVADGARKSGLEF